MLGFFKKKKEEELKMQLNRGLSKLDRDIYLIQQWIGHLHEKGEDTRNSHFQHVELSRKELAEINRWVRYLHAHNIEMHKFVKETTNNIMQLRKNYEEIMKRLEKIEGGHLRTLERTIQGQIKDMSLKKEDISIKNGNLFIVEKEKMMQKSEFAGSEIEMLNVLYHADRPLSYEECSKILGKKEKSVRNLIYELREKGVKIKSKPIGIRKKGFFIDREEKVRVSGR